MVRLKNKEKKKIFRWLRGRARRRYSGIVLVVAKKLARPDVLSVRPRHARRSKRTACMVRREAVWESGHGVFRRPAGFVKDRVTQRRARDAAERQMVGVKVLEVNDARRPPRRVSHGFTRDPSRSFFLSRFHPFPLESRIAAFGAAFIFSHRWPREYYDGATARIPFRDGLEYRDRRRSRSSVPRMLLPPQPRPEKQSSPENINPGLSRPLDRR